MVALLGVGRTFLSDKVVKAAGQSISKAQYRKYISSLKFGKFEINLSGLRLQRGVKIHPRGRRERVVYFNGKFGL